jgi:hypothetical protein
MNALTQPTNFGDWCQSKLRSGHIRVIGDAETGYELAIPDETLEAAYIWLSSRYDDKNGGECLDFLADCILDEMTDKYAAKLLVAALDASDAQTLVTTMRLVRHNYVQKAAEHHKAALVRLSESRGPDPMEVRKERIEVWTYPRLIGGVK